MKTLSHFILTLALFSAIALGQPPAPYNAVEVDPFAADKAVNLPSGYPTALADSIARELSVEFSTLIILRPGESAPDRRTVLRISGTIIQFKSGSSAKRLLAGFGGTVVTAEVRFGDASTGRVVTIREFQAGPDTLGKKIARFCKSEHLVDAN